MIISSICYCSIRPGLSESANYVSFFNRIAETSTVFSVSEMYELFVLIVIG